MQLTLFCRCTDREKLLCSCPVVWHSRQRALLCCAVTPLKVKILLTSPPPSTWALPGPWQSSQPCLAMPPFASICCQWRELSQDLYSSAWQALQVSAPTYVEGVAGGVAAGLAAGEDFS